jgi:hypothetical protein
VVLGGALLVAVASVSFAAGRATAPSALEELRANAPGGGQFFPGGGNGPGQGGQGFPGQGGPGGQGGQAPIRGAGGLAIEGTVQSIDGDSLTITTEGGQTIELSLDGDTTYHSSTSADATSVSSGSWVVVGGGAAFGQGLGVELDADDVTVVP